jgi:Ribonuclease HIII
LIIMNENIGIYITFENLKMKLENNFYKVSNIKQIEYGIQFRITFQNWSELMRIYQNKKGDLKFDFSQIKNSEHLYKIQQLIEMDNVPFKPVISQDIVSQLGFPIIGTDESGKGDYFGPLVAAGVFVDENAAIKLKSIGVKDSKLLSDSNIHKISPKIQDICFNKFSVIEISPEKYNELYEQFQKERKNLNTLLAWGHAKAIEEILTWNKCDKAISDQFADERYILSKLQERGKMIELVRCL